MTLFCWQTVFHVSTDAAASAGLPGAGRGCSVERGVAGLTVQSTEALA